LYLIIYTYSIPSTPLPVPLPLTRTLLPAIMLGYYLPSALLYYPYKHIDNTMIVTAFWQASPIYVNVLWTIFASPLPSAKPGQDGRSARNIKVTLLVVGAISALYHWTTIHRCLTSQNPNVNLHSVFLPRQYFGMTLEDALHYIFQIDYLFMFSATSVWCLQVYLRDQGGPGIKRESENLESSNSRRRLGWNLVLGCSGLLTVGPGAVLCVVWYIREGRLQGRAEWSEKTGKLE
jgi:hypothetical protein